MFRRCDGIGRRAGLKIQSWRQGAGSTPATGTNPFVSLTKGFFHVIPWRKIITGKALWNIFINENHLYEIAND